MKNKNLIYILGGVAIVAVVGIAVASNSGSLFKGSLISSNDLSAPAIRQVVQPIAVSKTPLLVPTIANDIAKSRASNPSILGATATPSGTCSGVQLAQNSDGTLQVKWTPNFKGITKVVSLYWQKGGLALSNDPTFTTSYSVGSNSLPATAKLQAFVNSATSSNVSLNITCSLMLNQTPVAPTLVVPYSGANEAMVTPTLYWATAKDATSYHIQVATDASFNNIVIDQANILPTPNTPGGNTTFIANGLIINNKYFWRVNATNAAGTGSYSAIWNFTTPQTNMKPDVPTLTYPIANVTGVPTSPTLTWNATGATSYDLNIFTFSGTDDEGRPIAVTVKDAKNLLTNSYTATGLTPNTTYDWYVVAHNSYGTTNVDQLSSFTTGS